MKPLWTEKYRPTVVEEYVWRDENQKAQVLGWIKEQSIPHLLLSGSAGLGKTTLAKMLVNELNIDPYDFLEVNASRENNVDTMRQKIVNFVQTMPFGHLKVVLLDEADYITQNAQAILRGIMETYASTCRFILTCNYPNKIIPALHSRTQGFHLETLDVTEFTTRVATILLSEEIGFNIETLDTYVRAHYPDLRKCINSVEANSRTGTLVEVSTSSSTSDYMVSAVALFKAKKFREARKLICENVSIEEIEDIYRWMYNNLDMFAETDEGQDKAVVIIKNGIVNHGLVAIPEINLAACFIELSNIGK